MLASKLLIARLLELVPDWLEVGRQLRIGAGHTNIINYSPDHILDVEGVRKDGSRVALDAMLKATRDASGHITAITAHLREVENPVP